MNEEQFTQLCRDTSFLLGLEDVDGLGKFSYQWLNNGIAIPGEIKTAYTLTRTDVGKTIGVHIKFSDGCFYSVIIILRGHCYRILMIQ
jgi:hypothetical protein